MHPNLYLQTFWRMKLKPQVFVAMSFDTRYKARFENVIAPAIRDITFNGVALQPHRVDLSKSGDSILSEINDGIAHSRLVLADVSSVGKDSVTGYPYRNANVMYEVGLAMTCRQPHEVLLVRDDNDKFLFDVSTIPHKRIDFTNIDMARAELHDELLNRLKEDNHINDARVKKAISGLTGGEISLLKYIASLPPTCTWGRPIEGNVQEWVSIPRLLDKHLIYCSGEFEEGFPAYHATELGYIVAKIVEGGLRKIKADKKEDETGKNDEENKSNI
jgi:hypothetical protein